MNTSLSRSLVAISVALTLPASALAAAPTQAQLNAALDTLVAQRPFAVDGTLSITETERGYTRSYVPENTSAQMSFSARFLAESNGHTDSEGRIHLDNAQFPTQTQPTSNVGSLDWRAIGGTAYLFVGVPAAALEPLAASGIDLSSVVNSWVRIDGSTSTSAEEPTPLSSLSAIPGVSTITGMQSESLNLKDRVRIQRVESRTTVNGHSIARLRLVPNYVTIAKEQAAQRAQIIKTTKGAERAAALKENATTYTTLRSSLQKLHTVAVYDETDQRITRIEMGGTEKKPKQECDFTGKNFKMVCKNVAMQTTTFAVGMNISTNASTAAIVAPATSTSLEDILSNAFNSFASSTQEEVTP